jgi:hypothetical protein
MALRADPPASSPARAALDAAAAAGKYAFVLFWKQDDETTQSMSQTVQTVARNHNGRVTVLSVATTEPAEKAVVDQFGISRAPLPLVLAIAPNGAVTGGFPQKVSEAQLAGAFVSASMAESLKALQGRKMVLLCVQSRGQAVPAGVREFTADPRYQPYSVIVTMDPANPEEARHLKQLSVDPARDVPATLLLAPPGYVLGKFTGPVQSQQLIEKLKSSQSCCPGGKCAGGCCGGPK